MKKTYTEAQIREALDFWQKRLNESLSAGTEEKLKAAAKKFAKWFGEQIKSGQAQRFEDGNYDALIAIKDTIKMNSSAKNMIKFLKSPQNTVVPAYAIEAVAEAASKEFIANVFDGSKALVEELNRAIEVFEANHFEATENYIEALANAIQNEKDKKLQNLKKSTEQFNYFANVVFGIWRRDPEIAKTLGRIPQLPTNAKDLEDLRAEFNPEDGEEIADGEEQEAQTDASEDLLSDENIQDSEGHKKTDESEEKEEVNEDDKPAWAEKMNGNIVGSLISVLQKNCDPSDQLLVRMNPGKQECFIFDVYSKNGYAIIDIVKGRPVDPKDI